MTPIDPLLAYEQSSYHTLIGEGELLAKNISTLVGEIHTAINTREQIHDEGAVNQSIGYQMQSGLILTCIFMFLIGGTIYGIWILADTTYVFGTIDLIPLGIVITGILLYPTKKHFERSRKRVDDLYTDALIDIEDLLSYHGSLYTIIRATDDIIMRNEQFVRLMSLSVGTITHLVHTCQRLSIFSSRDKKSALIQSLIQWTGAITESHISLIDNWINATVRDMMSVGAEISTLSSESTDPAHKHILDLSRIELIAHAATLKNGQDILKRIEK